MQVHLGFFENFKSRDTILICGDLEGLQALADVLRTLEEPDLHSIRLHDLSMAIAHGSIELTAYPVDRELGVRREDSRLPHFSWHHSEEGWLEAAEKIEGVIHGSGRGHAYLDSIGVEDATVMVSIGEYGDTLWEKNT